MSSGRGRSRGRRPATRARRRQAPRARAALALVERADPLRPDRDRPLDLLGGARLRARAATRRRGSRDYIADVGIWVVRHVPALRPASHAGGWVYNRFGIGTFQLAAGAAAPLALRLPLHGQRAALRPRARAGRGIQGAAAAALRRPRSARDDAVLRRRRSREAPAPPVAASARALEVQRAPARRVLLDADPRGPRGRERLGDAQADAARTGSSGSSSTTTARAIVHFLVHGRSSRRSSFPTSSWSSRTDGTRSDR